MLKTYAIAVAAVASAALSLNAQAQTLKGQAPLKPDNLTAHVSYGDLNLRSEAGALILLSRLSRATDIVCGGRPGYGQMAARARAWRQCREQSLSEAVVSVGAPVVSRLYAEVYGR